MVLAVYIQNTGPGQHAVHILGRIAVQVNDDLRIVPVLHVLAFSIPNGIKGTRTAPPHFVGIANLDAVERIVIHAVNGIILKLHFAQILHGVGGSDVKRIGQLLICKGHILELLSVGVDVVVVVHNGHGRCGFRRFRGFCGIGLNGISLSGFRGIGLSGLGLRRIRFSGLRFRSPSPGRLRIGSRWLCALRLRSGGFSSRRIT